MQQLKKKKKTSNTIKTQSTGYLLERRKRDYACKIILGFFFFIQHL